ncbi:urease accessory protein UreE [Marivivens donghaensis]|uniref:Urease accessory protein UreE n=1 Tax=Marivivens donghaensis TaxID=1699413 RepID=A0ABX0W3D0_9RHOB|nr:urease accessory protein UreE [Marivivens donghaensis]NIY73892.1 urease accessory protein UreE [Marivivens donghaensis]
MPVTQITFPVARTVTRGPNLTAPDTLTLTYEDRFLRRKKLDTDSGAAILIDLKETTSLNQGDVLETEHGGVMVMAAAEDLIEVRGHNLGRLAWHIGNRHTPCQIEHERILIKHDHVIEDMLKLLGAEVKSVTEPFTPEGGAYGHGRTHGHEH